MRKRKLHKKNQQAAARKAFVFEELEPRVLLSADLPLDLPDTNVPEEFSDQEILQDINAQQYASPAQDAVSRELIFVDTDTPEYRKLLSDLLTYPDDTTSYQVFELDNTRDGIAQITEVLSNFENVDAIHILSHGTEAAIDLGGSTLDSDALAVNAERVSSWGSAFSEQADILIYGCNLAATPEGKLLVNSLSTLTGADVAASDDLTGNAALGGDWELEYRSGNIETSIAVSDDMQQHWQGQLASPAGGEFRVNSTTSGTQETELESPNAVAADASGNFVVVWTAPDANRTGVFAQLYNAAGVAQGSEFRVNTTTSDEQHHASVAMDDAGNFVVTWASEGQDADNPVQHNIYAQRYNAAGVAQGGEFRVNTDQLGDQLYSTVAMDADGDFVITWTGFNEIYAQRYNAAGVAQGGEFQVNSYTFNKQEYSSVAMDDAGNFVITWTSKSQDANRDGIYAQRYNAAGVAQGGEFRVNSEEVDDQLLSTVAMDADGDFVITWTSVNQDGDTSSDGNIYAQRYNAAGVAQGGEFRVNGTTAGDQRNARVAMDAAGNFTVTWMGFGQDGDSSIQSNIYAREYNADGTAVGIEYRVNTTTSGNQQNSSVARVATGDYIIVWSGNGTGDSDGVFGQRYDVNEAPVNTVPGPQVTNEDSALVFSSGAGNPILVADVDAGGNDLEVTLTATNGILTLGGITGLNFTSGDGTNDVTMTFTGTVAEINTALNGLIFTPDPDFNGAASLEIITDDQGYTGSGGAQTDTDTVDITVNPVDDGLPVAIDDSASTSEDTGVMTVNVLTNDTLTDHAAITGFDAVSAQGGSVIYNGDGTFTYTPGEDFYGTDTFTYTLTDDESQTATATVTITVNAVIDVVSDVLVTDEDTVGNLNVLTNDSFGPGATVSAVTQGTNGTVAFAANGDITYTPAEDCHGADSFTYTVTTAAGDTEVGTVNVTVTTVSDIVNDVLVTDEDTVGNLNVLTNDSFGPGATVTAVTQGSNGTVAFAANGDITYIPGTDFNGADSFTYTVTTAAGNTEVGTVNVTVNAVVDVANDVLVTDEDTAGNLNVLTNDSFGPGATVTAVTQGTNGTVAFAANGDITYTPGTDFNGADSFTYTVTTAAGDTEVGTVNAMVNPVDDGLPVALDDSASTSEDSGVTTGNVLANDIQTDHAVITGFDAVSTQGGSVSYNGDGTFSYTPGTDFNGADTFTYTLTDDEGQTATATVTITVNAVIDVVSDVLVTDEDTVGNLNVLTNDSFGPGATVTAVTQGANGTVAFAANGDITYTPAEDYHGADSFTYTVTTAAGDTEVGTVNVTMNAVIDVVDDVLVTNEDTAGNLNVLNNDSFGPGATVTAVTQGANGTVGFAANGDITYTPADNFNGADSFTYTVTTAAGNTEVSTVNVTVNAVNDTPVNSIPGGQTTSEGTPLVFSSLDGNSISVTDPDDTGAMLKVTLAASNGTLNLSGTNGLVFEAGDGIDDATMTFTGTAADINAALDGLLFQPDTDYQGFATVQLITDDLGNSGAGGVLNTLDSISISVVEDAPVSDDLPPLDELIVDYPDLPEVDPDPEPLSPTVFPAAPVQESSGTARVSNVDPNGSGSHATSTSGGLHAEGDITIHESIVSAGGHADQERSDDRSISTRIWNAITDPLVSVRAIATLPPGALIWDFIDLMSDQINTDNSVATDNKLYMIGTTTTGVTFAFSAGYVSWLLRAGYLSAAILSSAPVWRQFDPLPILGKPEEVERTAEKDGQDSGQSDDKKVDDIFEPDARNGANEAVS